MITIKYKNCWIHDNFTSGVITVQDAEYNIYKGFKSFRAAQLFITKTLSEV